MPRGSNNLNYQSTTINRAGISGYGNNASLENADFLDVDNSADMVYNEPSKLQRKIKRISQNNSIQNIHGVLSPLS